jgi:hypothetical protein
MPFEPGHRYLFPRHWFAAYEAFKAQSHRGDQYSCDELVRILSDLGLTVTHARTTFGFWGKLAWEITMLVESHRRVLRALLPVLLAAGVLDVVWPRRSRTAYGVLVLGRKRKA